MTKHRVLAVSTILLGAGAIAAAALRGPGAPDDAVASPAPPPAAAAAPDPWAKPAVLPRYSMRYTRWETISKKDGLPSERTTCVLPLSDRLVVGTEHGLAIRKNGVWTAYGAKDGLAHDYVSSVAFHAPSGDLWISTLSGLSRLSGGKFTTYHQLNSGLVNDLIYHCHLDGDLLWVGTGAGGCVLDVRTGVWQSWDHRNSIMHEPWNYAVATGPGRTWIALWGGAIVERDNTTGFWREYRDPDGEFEIDVLPDDGPLHEVTSFICYDSGVLWQATYFGLARFDGRRWNSWVNKDSGLAGDFINHVASRGHTVWVSTDEGFSAFDGDEWWTYKRRDDGRGDVIHWKGGKEVSREVQETALAHNYLLQSYPQENEVWVATGLGISHGIADTAPAAPPAGN